MLISPIILQLQSVCTLANIVEQSINVNAATPDQLPVILVTPLSESAESSRYDNYVGQTVKATISLVIGSAASNDSLQAIRQQVFQALLGFVPYSGADAIEFEGGDLLDMTNGTIWWKDTFIYNYFLRQS